LTPATADRITDFKASESDKIQVSRTAFGISSTAKVTFTSTADITKGLSTSSLFVLDSTTGELYLNANGSTTGFGSGGVFAVLDKTSNGAVPALSASNFALI
jgi:Ca2+-binding RTX toxin-like protein